MALAVIRGAAGDEESRPGLETEQSKIPRSARNDSLADWRSVNLVARSHVKRNHAAKKATPRLALGTNSGGASRGGCQLFSRELLRRLRFHRLLQPPRTLSPDAAPFRAERRIHPPLRTLRPLGFGLGTLPAR